MVTVGMHRSEKKKKNREGVLPVKSSMIIMGWEEGDGGRQNAEKIGKLKSGGSDGRDLGGV